MSTIFTNKMYLFISKKNTINRRITVLKNFYHIKLSKVATVSITNKRSEDNACTTNSYQSAETCE